jgi:uncharacterized linocin/CFP29 family protein
MAFQKALIVAVENGFMVSLTKLDLTERGYVPSDSHYIAADLKDAIAIVEDKKGATKGSLEIVK